MSYRIDDDENRIQDLKDQIDQLEVQTFSPEVVARNESTRNTGIETGDSAALNPYPMWIPIRDFGDVGLVTQEIVLNRVDSHVAKMTITGDVDFAFSIPPPTNKMMWFILDTTIDSTGGYTINLLNNILPAGITIDNTANARTVIRFTTTDGGVTYYAEDLTTGGAGNVPDPTTEFQHLQSDGSNNWIAQEEFQFGAMSADSAKINFPNDTIGIAWRNATDDGNLELKGTTAGNLDITRDDNTSISLSLRSQNAIELDQSLSITVGSGSITSADIVIDASTAKLLIAVGGSTRLTLDTLVNTALILKSPTGITAQSSFDVVSTHVSEADQNISIFVGSGDAADAILSTSANIFKLAVDNTVRWELDVNIGNEITQTAFGINPLYTLFNDDPTPNDFDQLGRINFSGRNSNADKIIYAGIFVESSDVSNNSEDAIMFFSIIQAGIISPIVQYEPFIMKLNFASMELDEIVLPIDPPANKGKIYLRDVGGITTPFFLDSTGTETSLIAAGASGNIISQGDSSIVVNDVGIGVINFTVDGVAVGNISTAFGWILDNSDLVISDANGKIIMNNGFEIENTNAILTEFNIPSGETLTITEGLATRISITDDIIINCDNAGNITFQEFGNEVAKYDGSLDSWKFSADVTLGDSITDNLIVNALVVSDVVFDSGSTIDYFDFETTGFVAGAADALPATPSVYLEMRIQGANIFVPAYAKS